jgi:hypothetical protein
VLARDFPTLAAALGADGFHDLATAYLCVHPPERPSLRHAGERLAAFLEGAAAAAPFLRRWPFAADLARLEWALTAAFDAPDAAPLERTELADLSPERWVDLRLALHPSVQRLAVDWDVLSLREAWETGGDAPACVRAASTAIVWRRRERVLFRALDAEEAEMLTGVASGTRFGELCERLAACHGEEAAAPCAAAWLSSWVAAELLTRRLATRS